MALGQIPPWLNVGPDLFTGAMRAGAGLGAELRGQDISARGQDIAAGEARDRLSFAYAQLQANEERLAEQAQAKMALAHAQLQARQEQADLMNQFREKAMDLKQKQVEDLSSYRAGLAVAQGDKLALSQLRLEDLEKHRKAIEDLQAKAEARRSSMEAENLQLRKQALAKKGFHYSPDGSIWQTDPTSGQLKMVKPPRMSPEDAVQDEALKSQMHALSTELAQSTSEKRRKQILPQLEDVVKQRKALRGNTPEMPAETPEDTTPPPDKSADILQPSSFVGAAAGVPGASTADLTPSTVGQPQPPARIRVKHPDGSSGTIPADQAAAAKAAGYTIQEEDQSDASSND